MRKHKIIAVLWEDHTRFTSGPMTNDPDTAIMPTLSVGILYKQTKKSLVLVTDIEKYETRDDITYTIILKPAIISQQEYGEITLEKLRE